MLPGDFDRIVLRCANQTPVRYFNDGLHDGSFSHYGLWVYCTGIADRLIADLNERGMDYAGKFNDGQYVAHKFTVPRERLYHADLPPIDPSEG